MNSEEAVMNTYGTRNTTLTKGEGVYVWDTDGRRYLDALSGIAVCGLGHCHPAVTNAICDQANTLLHCSNLYNIEPQQRLGKSLAEIAGMEKVFFSNSGAEANEAAIKIARKYGNEKGVSNPQVITASGSFHGRTMATLTATGNPKVKQGFAPLLDGFIHAPFNDIGAIKDIATENTVAILVEPIQGEGGVNVPAEGYLKTLRQLCDEKGWLLMLDEIQTGNGRTGKFFAYQHEGILPDVLTTAKGLGNGMPIGACLTRGKASDILQPGSHGSTFGGNPVATNAALAVVETINAQGFVEQVAQRGADMVAAFKEATQNNPAVVDVRGKGLMIGIELNRECTELVDKAKEKGMLINVTAGNTIRLLPPLIISDNEAQSIVDTVLELIEELTE